MPEKTDPNGVLRQPSITEKAGLKAMWPQVLSAAVLSAAKKNGKVTANLILAELVLISEDVISTVKEGAEFDLMMQSSTEATRRLLAALGNDTAGDDG